MESYPPSYSVFDDPDDFDDYPVSFNEGDEVVAVLGLQDPQNPYQGRQTFFRRSVAATRLVDHDGGEQLLVFFTEPLIFRDPVGHIAFFHYLPVEGILPLAVYEEFLGKESADAASALTVVP